MKDLALDLPFHIFRLFLLSILLFVLFAPSPALAQSEEEKLASIFDALLEIRAQIALLQEAVTKLSPQPFTLAPFLEELFQEYNVTLKRDDFLESTDNPALSLAKVLNLIPLSREGSEKLSQQEAAKIRQRFLLVKDEVANDGLFGKIDMHEHYRTGGDLEAFFRAAGALGVSKAVFVPTGWGPDNRGYKNYQAFLVSYYKKLYPERIIAFCTIDEADPEAAQDLEACLKAGGQGLKLLGGHPNFYDEPLNSDKMRLVYEVVAKYQVPILIHGSIINVPETEAQLDQVFSNFPTITFIHAHYCSAIFKGINLDKCQTLLDEHPNLYIDLSMGGGIKRYHKYLRQDLDKIRDFVIKNQDRILFGSDIILDHSSWKDFAFVYDRMRCDLDLHQKEIYRCPYGEKDSEHQGFNLPREILKKLYYENPKKILNL